MDQLICAFLSHTHYWYEVGMLEVPAMYGYHLNRRLRAQAKPPVDRRRLVTDPQLRQEEATAIGR